MAIEIFDNLPTTFLVELNSSTVLPVTQKLAMSFQETVAFAKLIDLSYLPTFSDSNLHFLTAFPIKA